MESEFGRLEERHVVMLRRVRPFCSCLPAWDCYNIVRHGGVGGAVGAQSVVHSCADESFTRAKYPIAVIHEIEQNTKQNGA